MKMLNFLLLMPFLITSNMFAQLASDYYPLHVGDYWIQHTDSISGEYQPTTFRKDIEAIDLIGSEEYFRMRQTLTADDGSSEGTWYAWLRIDSSGVLMGAMGDTSIVDSVTIFDPPLLWSPNEMITLGSTWEIDFPEMGGLFSFTVESISESVLVPAGSFGACIKTKLIITDTSGDTTQWNYFYSAAGIGEVLNIGWNSHAENFEFELIEYSVQPSVDVKKSPTIPILFSLHQNYPNPFNPVTTISYQLPKSSFVNLSIYNVSGQLVEKLVYENKNAGYYLVEWNASAVGSGVYFYRIEAGSYTETKKCVILK